MKKDGKDPSPKLLWKGPSALLIYMAFAFKHTRPKNQVLGTLWPDARRPGHSLTQARFLLDEEGDVVIEDVGDQLRLDPSTVEIDTTRFEQLVREQKWSEAAAMVEGEFLEGFTASETSGFDDWLEAEREKWRAKCADVLTRHARNLLDGGAPERAEEVAERTLRLMSHSGPALMIYMTALGLQDRWTEGLAAGEQFTKRVTDPGIVAFIEEYRKLAARQKRKSAPKPRPPLFGRSAQLQKVMDVWRDSLAGDPCVVLVRGEEGMGKTRFAGEVMDRARFDGATVAISRAVPGDPSQAEIELVTMAEGGLLHAPGVAGASPAAMAALSERSTLWGTKYQGRAAGEPLPFLQAMTEVIRAVAAESPVLLVVDDAQYMDASSLQTLIGLVRSLEKSRVMVLLTLSPAPFREELEEVRSKLGRDYKGVEVALETLSHADLMGMAHWLLPSYNQDEVDRIARRVGAESGGFPLIAYVIFTAVVDGLVLKPLMEPWPRPKNTYGQDLPTDPADNLVGAINVRFGRLAADAQLVLKVLAVLGGPCLAKRLAQGAELPQSRIDDALDQLESRQWLVADPRGYSILGWAIRDIVKARQVGHAITNTIQERMRVT